MNELKATNREQHLTPTKSSDKEALDGKVLKK